jgi:hypothetical protein
MTPKGDNRFFADEDFMNLWLLQKIYAKSIDFLRLKQLYFEHSIY